jgi:hypothetical protein
MSGDDPKDKDPLRPKTAEAIRDTLLNGVGYKHPPKHSQFQPGRSGNPKGPPRAAAPDLSLAEQPTLDAMLRAAQKLVRVREGERTLEVPLREALARSIVTSAINGNPRAQGLAVDLFRQAEQKHAQEIQEQNAFWLHYKEVMSARLADAAAKGEPAPLMLPHPDDIVIDPLNGPRFLGPLEEEGEAALNETLALCETLIMQDVLDERSTQRLNGEPVTEPGGALLMYYALQGSVPPRLRLSEIQATIRRMKYDAWPMRRLLKEVFQSWQRIGKPKPRGWVTPEQSIIAKKLLVSSDLITSMVSGHIDANALARGEPDDATLDILDKHGIRFVPDNPAERHSEPLARRTARGR